MLLYNIQKLGRHIWFHQETICSGVTASSTQILPRAHNDTDLRKIRVQADIFENIDAVKFLDVHVHEDYIWPLCLD